MDQCSSCGSVTLQHDFVAVELRGTMQIMTLTSEGSLLVHLWLVSADGKAADGETEPGAEGSPAPPRGLLCPTGDDRDLLYVRRSTEYIRPVKITFTPRPLPHRESSGPLRFLFSASALVVFKGVGRYLCIAREMVIPDFKQPPPPLTSWGVKMISQRPASPPELLSSGDICEVICSNPTAS